MSREAGRAAALALAIALAFSYAFDRANGAAWREPLSYGGDAWAFLAAVKAAHDGHVRPLQPIDVPELGAPFGASWNDYPNRQPTLLWLSGRLARPLGLFGAINLVALVASVLAGLAFYAVARHLRARWEWGMAFGFAFALSPFFFWRAPEHLSLCLYWHLPLCLLVSAWAFSHRGLDGSRRPAVGIVVAVAAGLGNFYYAALFVQLLLGAALAQALRRRGMRAIARPLLLASITVVFLAVENAYFLRHQWTHGRNPGALTRGYGDVERFALKPLELVLPRPGQGLLDWGAPFEAYWLRALVRGEQGSAYLGLVGTASFLALLLAPLVSGLRRRRITVSPAFLAATWILSFSVVGGVNGLLSLGAPPWLRATNRFSIALLALALLPAALRLSRDRLLHAPVPRRLLALGLCLLAGADQMRSARMPRVGPGLVRDPALDEAFTRAVEAALPAGAMLFMLPVQPFPEWPPQHRMRDYEHFRPYLFSTRLRFSYGTDRGRSQEEWQEAVGAMSPESMIHALERYGFAGLVLNRNAFEDGGDELLLGLLAAGRPASATSTDLVLVPLQPWPRPELPVSVAFSGS